MSSANHTGKANRRIDEELVSVDSLKHVLCTRCGCKEVHFHRERHDPPDFTAKIDGHAFPAEVTSVVSDQRYHAQCDEFAKAVRARADSLGILFGMYVLKVSRLPCIPKPTSQGGCQLLKAAVAYVDATREKGTSPEVRLAQDGSGKISIQKVSADGSRVVMVRFASAMWGTDIQRQLASLIQQAVDNKKRKLQDAGINSGRALLLLYDAFAYGEPQDALTAMKQVNGCDWFHSIFWAASFFDRKNTTYPEEPGRNGLFLFSNNPGWNKIGTIPIEIDA